MKSQPGLKKIYLFDQETSEGVATCNIPTSACAECGNLDDLTEIIVEFGVYGSW